MSDRPEREVEGLIEELRTAAYVDGTAHGDDEQHANDADLAEARLRDALRTLTAERDRLEAENERLREASLRAERGYRNLVELGLLESGYATEALEIADELCAARALEPETEE